MPETTCVSHSSTESEIISLEHALRNDALPILSFWDTVVDIFAVDSTPKLNVPRNDKNLGGGAAHKGRKPGTLPPAAEPTVQKSGASTRKPQNYRQNGEVGSGGKNHVLIGSGELVRKIKRVSY